MPSSQRRTNSKPKRCASKVPPPSPVFDHDPPLPAGEAADSEELRRLRAANRRLLLELEEKSTKSLSLLKQMETQGERWRNGGEGLMAQVD